MNIVNDDILLSILTSKHSKDGCCSIRILDRRIENDIVKAGNNYSTVVSRLIVRYQLQGPAGQQDDQTIKEKALFLKVPSIAPLFEVVKQFGSYDNEVAMYTEVLPRMYTFEDEYFTPRQYYFDDKQSLVLKDLSRSGYKCADRVQQLDVEHCFYALRCLAKFHALSVKVERTCGLPTHVKRDPFMNTDTEPNEHTTAFMSQIPVFIDSLPRHLTDQYPDMVADFQSLLSPETFFNMIKVSTDHSFNVLNHGDFWTNNIMFKYDKYDAIKKAKLIDLQLTSWRSPAKDLIYFTITSMKYEVYEKYFPLLLKIYLDTLNKALGRLNCPTYNMHGLLEDIDGMTPYALLVLCCVLPVIISDPEDPIDTKEMCKNDKFEVNSVAKAYKQKHFQEIASKWFEHFARNGTLGIEERNTASTSSVIRE